MSCTRKLALCDYCKHRDDHCPGYSGWCFVQTEEARQQDRHADRAIQASAWFLPSPTDMGRLPGGSMRRSLSGPA